MEPNQTGPLSGKPQMSGPRTDKSMANTNDQQVQKEKKIVTTKSSSTQTKKQSTEKKGVLASIKKNILPSSKTEKVEKKQANVRELSLEENLEIVLSASHTNAVLNQINNILELHKSSPKECVLQVKQFLRKKDKDGAILNKLFGEAFNPINTSHPKKWNAYGSLALILLDAGHKFPDKTFQLMVNNSSSGEKLRAAFEEQGKTERAFQIIETYKPTHMSMSTEQWKEILPHIPKYLELNPDKIKAWDGILQEQIGNDKKPIIFQVGPDNEVKLPTNLVEAQAPDLMQGLKDTETTTFPLPGNNTSDKMVLLECLKGNIPENLRNIPSPIKAWLKDPIGPEPGELAKLPQEDIRLFKYINEFVSLQ